MKKDELEHIMEGILDDAKSLISKDGYIAPVAFMCVGKVMHIVKLNFKDKEEKEKQVSILTTMARIQKADALIMVVESWYVASDRPNLEIEPSKHPMRKECIFIVGECNEGKVTIAQKFEREKGENRDRIIFGERDDIDTFGFSKLNFGMVNRKKYDNNNLKSDIKNLRSNLN